MGRFLQDAREISGLTLEQVAKAAGVSTAYVQKLEKGERKGTRSDSRDTLVRVARAANADVDAVLTLAGHMESKEARNAAVAQAAVERAIKADHTLSQQDKRWLLDAVAYVRRPVSPRR